MVRLIDKDNILSARSGWLILLLFFLLMLGCDKKGPKEARVTFQFDDASVTQYTAAKPLFDAKGIKATLMITTSFVGKSKYYMSWNQVKEMYEEGWEIGSHSVNHVNLREADEEIIRYELSRSKEVLSAHGVHSVENLAYPYSYYDMDLLYLVSDYYRSARTSVAQTGFNINPIHINPYELSSYECRLTAENVADAYKYVDKAQKEGRWLIFLLHEFSGGKSNDIIKNKKEITEIKALEMLIDYIRKSNIPIVTTTQALDYFIGPQ